MSLLSAAFHDMQLFEMVCRRGSGGLRPHSSEPSVWVTAVALRYGAGGRSVTIRGPSLADCAAEQGAPS